MSSSPAALSPDTIDALWRDYCVASRRAQATLAIEDGLAAGRAYRQWCELFLAHDPAVIVGAAPVSNVVQLRRAT